mgnify:CR=1 FL=1
MVGPIDSVIGWLMIGQKIDWKIDWLHCLTYLIKRLYWNNLAPAVRRSYNTIRSINLYPVDNAKHFAITYPLGGDLSIE